MYHVSDLFGKLGIHEMTTYEHYLSDCEELLILSPRANLKNFYQLFVKFATFLQVYLPSRKDKPICSSLHTEKSYESYCYYFLCFLSCDHACDSLMCLTCWRVSFKSDHGSNLDFKLSYFAYKCYFYRKNY